MRFRRTIARRERRRHSCCRSPTNSFAAQVLEEKIFAVTMLQGIVGDFGKPEFKLFESWLDRVGTWADHDALVHYLIGPMIAKDDSLLSRPLRWAKSKNRWHQRAAAVSLIHSTRQHKNFAHIQRVTEMLLASDDDMVQKGLRMAAARGCEVQSEANCELPDDHSRAHTEIGVEDRVRNASQRDPGESIEEVTGSN